MIKISELVLPITKNVEKQIIHLKTLYVAKMLGLKTLLELFHQKLKV